MRYDRFQIERRGPSVLTNSIEDAINVGVYSRYFGHIGSRDALSSRELFNYSSALGQSKST
jgi:hypothetical protein